MTNERSNLLPAVIVIDDEPAVQRSLKGLLNVFGLRVFVFSSAEAFLGWNTEERPGCLLVDALMPGMGGIGLLEEVRKRDSAVPVILMTGNAGTHFRTQAIDAGALDVLEKPFRVEQLKDLLIRHCPECFQGGKCRSDAC